VLDLHECIRHPGQPAVLHIPHVRHRATVPGVNEHFVRHHGQLRNVDPDAVALSDPHVDLHADRVHILPRRVVVPGQH